VSADPPDLTGFGDRSLNSLVRALTADGTARELAGRQAALEMFRDSRRRPRRRRLALSMSTAAAAVMLAGGIGAAYAAALPAPAQHIAYRMLGSIGVPDRHQPAPSSGAPRLAATIPPASSAPVSSAPASAGCPCPAGMPVAGNLVLTTAQTRIPADGNAVLSGRLAAGGQPEAGVWVRLYERTAGTPGWRVAAGGLTDGSGDVTLTVPGLTRNTVFRLAAPGGVDSAPVLITVIPPVYLELAPGLLPGRAALTVMAPFADPGDVAVLQEWSGGGWHRVAARMLGPNHRAVFTAAIPGEYRVVLPRTIAHGRSVSSQIRIAGRR